MSGITIARYKSVRYIGVFLREFVHNLAGFTKRCSLLKGVRYMACPLEADLTVSLMQDKKIRLLLLQLFPFPKRRGEFKILC